MNSKKRPVVSCVDSDGLVSKISGSSDVLCDAIKFSDGIPVTANLFIHGYNVDSDECVRWIEKDSQ